MYAIRSYYAFERNPRLMNIVSRGGSLMYAWMKLNNEENPFYEYYDELLDVITSYSIHYTKLYE